MTIKRKRREKISHDWCRRQAIERMLTGDKDGLLAPLLKDLLDAALSGQMQARVGDNRPNHQNGNETKTVKTLQGLVAVEMPRDHGGTFEPKLIAGSGPLRARA